MACIKKNDLYNILSLCLNLYQQRRKNGYYKILSFCLNFYVCKMKNDSYEIMSLVFLYTLQYCMGVGFNNQ